MRTFADLGGPCFIWRTRWDADIFASRVRPQVVPRQHPARGTALRKFRLPGLPGEVQRKRNPLNSLRIAATSALVIGALSICATTAAADPGQVRSADNSTLTARIA